MENNFLESPILSEKHIFLLYAYKIERNKTQALDAISQITHRKLSFGRHVLPLTKELMDLGYIIRTNPKASYKEGHNHVITEEGKEALENYLIRLNLISNPKAEFGF